MSVRALLDVPAPAKLNLFLHVVGRRADGYHRLQSVFVLIDWADTLHFEVRADAQLVRHDLGPALPADDLCLRAARALQQASGTAQGADISIQKQVPWGAGMGGGSSDAATTLLALNRLWQLHWPRARLLELALTLGADVPFFVAGNNALVQGIGEELRPVQVTPAAYAVVKPQATLNTRDIFEHPALRRDTAELDEAAILMGSLDSVTVSNGGGTTDVLGTALAAVIEASTQSGGSADVALPVYAGGSFGRNDLQAAAEDRCAEVTQVATWLQSRFGNSRMTGSGSAVFARVGLMETGSEVVPMATFPVHDMAPGWVGRMSLGLPQHPLRDWAA